MARRKSNKKIKGIIIYSYKKKGEEVCFETMMYNGKCVLTGWSLCSGDGFSEWCDYVVSHAEPVSLTANQLKGIE